MDIAVLGAGLDGLLAAHAVSQSGHKPVIFGSEDDQFSFNGFNSLLLRREIPGITDTADSWSINIQPDAQAKEQETDYFNGFGVRYEYKVFGGSDFDDYSEVYTLHELEDMYLRDVIIAYNASKAYMRLFDLYHDQIGYQWLAPKWYTKKSIRHDYDLVINTMDSTKWCAGSSGGVGHHRFPCVYYWTTNDAPYGPLKIGDVYLSDDPERPHYLQANIFGNKIVEWPESQDPPIPGIFRATRPLQKICNCDKELYDFINIGTMATWDHNWNPDDSYYSTIDAISDHLSTPQQLEFGQ